MVLSHEAWSRSQMRERERMKSLRPRICRQAVESVYVTDDACLGRRWRYDEPGSE